MTKTTGMNLDELNLIDPCETPFEFEYINEEDKPTGIMLSVVGSQSKDLMKWMSGEINARRKKDAMQEKRGKAVDIQTLEDDIEFSIESAARRLKGWKGITQECTPENALKLCTINPLVRSQIVDQSNNIGNFTKSK